MTINANSHPYKVVVEEGDGVRYANAHPIKVEVEGGVVTPEEFEELETKVDALATDLSYKGGVPTYEDLPTDPETGDVYTTDDTGILYVWNGTQWVPLNKSQAAIIGTDAPTTATEGELGQSYLDTTHQKIYYLAQITENPTTYVWKSYGPEVVQTTGTSTTDVMSQVAASRMIYPSGEVTSKKRIYIPGGTRYTPQDGGANNDGDIVIGGFVGRNLYGFRSVAIDGSVSGVTSVGTAIRGTIGESSTGIAINGSIDINCLSCVALGGTINAGHEYSVAFPGASTTTRGEFALGATFSHGYNGSAYRLLTGLYDGQSAHDAATVGQAVGTTESVTIADTDWSALSSSDPYTYSATKTLTATVGANSTVSLINDAAVDFATYGFAIGSVDQPNNTITLYSIGAPSASKSLTINIKG